MSDINKTKPELFEIHRITHRHWGAYEVLMDTEGFKVKRIFVKLSGRLSLKKLSPKRTRDCFMAIVTVDQTTTK